MKVHYKSLSPLVHWQSRPRPIAWDVVFDRSAPRELEIGFGSGEYLLKRAKDNPDTDFIGIEPAWTCVKLVLRRLNQEKVSNVRILFEDARIVLERCFASKSLNRIYALFPCPWPKEKHIKYRLFSNSFLQLANSRLIDAGELSVVTDHEEFCEWVREQNDDAGFDLSEMLVPPTFNTHYERKWERHGQDAFYSMSFQKSRHCEVAVKEDLPMQVHTVEKFDAQAVRFEDIRGPVTVAFKEWLFDNEKQKGMARVIVSEPPLTQDLWVEVQPFGNQWKVCPSSGSRWIPTRGAQLALDQVQAGLQNSLTDKADT